MTKTEFYNSLVNLYLKTGQGAPYLLFKNKMGEKFDFIINSLKEEGLIKLITQRYNHLPDDIWVCLTKGYCVEEGNTEELLLFRYYLGILDEDDKTTKSGFSLSAGSNKIRQSPELIEKYLNWLTTNQDKLQEIKTIKNLILDNKVGENLKNFIKNKSWFKENKNNEEILRINNQKISKLQKQKNILKELIPLERKSEKYVNSVVKHENELIDVDKELLLRKELNMFLEQNKDKKISELV
jgi:hypothetical protein